MKTQIIIALKFLFIMTILTGIIYPLVMTGLAQITYPSKANGSLILKDGKFIGSELIGQKFDSTIYFWGRPSAIGYNPVPSAGSNYGPTSDTLRKLVEARRIQFSSLNSLPDGTVIPTEMIFASGSGLDPHISPESALMQAERVANARHFSNDRKEDLINNIKKMTERPQYLFLGEPRINVLMLNLELDKADGNINTGK
jgi:K+-transporting ATPase ATPase C chain